jgi:hypothetical protein
MSSSETISTMFAFGGRLMIGIEKTLCAIFETIKDEVPRDPNDPADQPFFAVKPAIENQAFNAWCSEQGGEVVLSDLRKNIRSQIISIIEFPVRGFDDVFKFITLRQHLMDDMNWYLRIVNAFEKHEEKKAEAKGG